MNDEGSSSRAGPSQDRNAASGDEQDGLTTEIDRQSQVEAEIDRQRWAKKEHMRFLDDLLRTLDAIVYTELMTLYYLDCWFIFFLVRVLGQLFFLTPSPADPEESRLTRRPLFMMNLPFLFLHLVLSRPTGGEMSRGYLHGGAMIDFIGQKGPTSKIHMFLLDLGVLAVQLVMLSAKIKRHRLKRHVPSGARDASGTSPAEGLLDSGQRRSSTASQQDMDAEERGVHRRSSLNIAASMTSLDELVQDEPPDSPLQSTDALDTIHSGQAIIASLRVFETPNEDSVIYADYRDPAADGATNNYASVFAADVARWRSSVRFRLGGG